MKGRRIFSYILNKGYITSFMGSYMQGLFVPFVCIGSSDPVRVLHLFHNEYTG